MEYFTRFVEREDVKQLLEKTMSLDSVQGVVLDLDPDWLAAWRLMDIYGPTALTKDWIYNARWYELLLRGTGFWIPSRPITEKDLYWKPPYWQEYQKSLWNIVAEIPIIVKICLLPGCANTESSMPRFNDQKFRVVYETRSRARFYSDPKNMFRPILGGISLGCGRVSCGTLGGVLSAPTGERYGLTCSHLISDSSDVDQPAYLDGQRDAKVGTMITAAVLEKCAATDPCNPWIQKSKINDIDAAIFKIDESISSDGAILNIGRPVGITLRQYLTPGQNVCFNGRTSGSRDLELGGLGVYYRISDSHGNSYCFRNLVELRQPYFLRTLVSQPVQLGDSGAWVCTPAKNGHEWCAMVIGGDRFIGYAIASQTIQEWWTNEKNLTLTIL